MESPRSRPAGLGHVGATSNRHLGDRGLSETQRDAQPTSPGRVGVVLEIGQPLSRRRRGGRAARARGGGGRICYSHVYI
jgi:hypothetical protein